MGQSNDLDFNNLIKLQYISSLLWEIRKSNHAYTNSGNTKLMVKKITLAIQITILNSFMMQMNYK